ncbi:hypothetical protein FOZ61_004158 [Perkinsus olseni]|uniref:Structure-specific endonuclease subunit SLX4 n=1 Tax=Perkinsus olseni TaxID=32597 RepID=A0A7J6LLR9_PEROL|nr:hypothetical protein FOZ61_004158 [Perkinsus olseni]
MPPRKTTTRRKNRGLPKCLDELDMDQDDITKYFKPKDAGGAWTAAEVELLKRRIVTADRKIATLQLEKERLLNVLHEVPGYLLGGDEEASSPSQPEGAVVDLSQDSAEKQVKSEERRRAATSSSSSSSSLAVRDREAAIIRMMGRISLYCLEDLTAPSAGVKPPVDGPSTFRDKASSTLALPCLDGLPSPFPKVLDQHAPHLSNYPAVPGFSDDFDELFVLSSTELVATKDELEDLLCSHLNPLVYTKKDLERGAIFSIEFLTSLHEGVLKNKARGVSVEAVERYLQKLFPKQSRPRPSSAGAKEEESATTGESALVRNMATTDFCEQEEPVEGEEVGGAVDETEVMVYDAEPPASPLREPIPLTPNEMVSDNEGPVHLRYSEATSATLQQEGSSQDFDFGDLDLLPSSPVIEVSADEMSLLGEDEPSDGGGPSDQPPLPSSDDDDIQCLSGSSRPGTPEATAEHSRGGAAGGCDDWLSSLPLVERVKALGAMRRGSDVSRWANGTWKSCRLSLASLGVPEAPTGSDSTTLSYGDDEATTAAANDDEDVFMMEDSMADAVLVGGGSQDVLGETAASDTPPPGSGAPVEDGADARAGRSVLGAMEWEKLGDDELKRWMSFFGLKVASGTSSRGNMVRTLTEIARYIEVGGGGALDDSPAVAEPPKRKRQKRSPKKTKEEKKREAEEKRRANKLALVHAIRKDTEMWQRMLLFETIDLTDLSTRLKEQDPTIVCDLVLLRELLEEQGVQFCNTLQAVSQRAAARKPRGAASARRRPRC